MTSIPEQEEQLLDKVQRYVRALESKPREPTSLPDYGKQLIELRDEIAEARAEDVPPLMAQMERISGIAARRAEVAAPPVDPRSPYFAHMRLREAGRERDVLIGRTTHIDSSSGVRIVDWRHAPISQLYYRYAEGASYEESFGGREVDGEVLVRRTVTINDGVLSRIHAPQGVFVRRGGDWRHLEARAVELAGGQGSAARPDAGARGRLGAGEEGEQRGDRHLPEIAALLDPRQFELITAPDAGVVVIQGGAGSGKTTIGLHRMAYLAYRDRARFAPDKMLVITYGVALGAYISEVLPSLGVPGVRVEAFGAWAERLRREAIPWLPSVYEEDTPSVVTRLKKHPAVLRLLTKRARAYIESGRVKRGSRAVVGLWAEVFTDLPALQAAIADDGHADFAPGEIASAYRWCVERCVAVTEADPREREPAETSGGDDDTEPRARGPSRRGDDGERRGRERGSSRRASEQAGDEAGDDGRFVAADGREIEEGAKLDREDDAILLRLYQIIVGPLFATRARGKQPLIYEHVFVDEAQDLSPVELAVLFDTTSPAKSVTLAGDTAQKLYLDNGFRDWRTTLDDLGLSSTDIEPLRIAYRSTREVLEVAREVLGPLAEPTPPLAPRSGAPVEAHVFPQPGAAIAFLADALRPLFAREPRATVGVLARFAEQADAYYEGLRRGEVPNLRRVRAQDFTFRPGVDVTDIRQVKGLEFDYVVVVDVNASVFPATDETRHLLHIAATRAAHQLWLLVTGAPSPLVPLRLLDG